MIKTLKNVANIVVTTIALVVLHPESTFEIFKSLHYLIKKRGLNFEYSPPKEFVSKNVKKGICILGPAGGGKTLIYDFLQDKKSSGQSKLEEYKEFVYFIDKNKSITIREGIDIGGGDEYVNRYYEKMINDKNTDYCLFVFNAFKYLNDGDEEYQRKVRARLHFIFNKNILNKKAIIIGSHFDQFNPNDSAEVANKIKESTSDKLYSSLLTSEYLHLLNLKNEVALKVFFKLIFKN